jgi:amino acid efflux transporter
MNTRKIGPVLLSGLIIGPILGSGILILPPAVYEVASDYAIFAWLIMLGLSFLFAGVFGKLSILYPGDSGVAVAVEQAFGKSIKHLSSAFLIMAVCFGPVAVLCTAGHYLQLLTNQSLVDKEWLTFGMLVVTYVILTRNITSVGKVAFIMSSFVVITLLAGSLSTLFVSQGGIELASSIDVKDFGYSLLLLFWALIGWEVIGSYSLEMKDRENTIPKAIILSFSIIAAVSLSVALAFQWVHPKTQSLGILLHPLFGSLSTSIISIISIVLCISTVLLVIGAVARLISEQASAGVFPKWLAFRSEKNVPVKAFLLMFCIHTIVFVLSYFDWVTIQQLVAIANAFFLCNALLGILASIRIFSSWRAKGVSILLTLCFVTILFFSSSWILEVIIVVSGYFVCLQWQENRQKKAHLLTKQTGS